MFKKKVIIFKNCSTCKFYTKNRYNADEIEKKYI